MSEVARRVCSQRAVCGLLAPASQRLPKPPTWEQEAAGPLCPRCPSIHLQMPGALSIPGTLTGQMPFPQSLWVSTQAGHTQRKGTKLGAALQGEGMPGLGCRQLLVSRCPPSGCLRNLPCSTKASGPVWELPVQGPWLLWEAGHPPAQCPLSTHRTPLFLQGLPVLVA